MTRGRSAQEHPMHTNDYEGLEVPNTDPFGDWFEEEREPLLEDDVDECEEDDYSDEDSG